MKFYNWKSTDTIDLVIYQSVQVGDLGRTGYIIRAESYPAVSYLNKIMNSIMIDGFDSKWVTIDQLDEDVLFIDTKAVLFKLVDEYLGYQTGLITGRIK